MTMRSTSIKQIKFNRGQVTDLLSERVDMGLQNACGTVYNNTYINRYGQLEQAPTVKFASNGATKTKILAMFDTGEDLVLPIGINYTGTSVDYYSWFNTPYIGIRIVFGLAETSGYTETITKNCYREPSADYTEGGITYYAWGVHQKVHDGAADYKATCNRVFTTDPNPTTSDVLTVDWVVNKQPIYGLTVVIKTKVITSVPSATIIYTRSTSPSANDPVYDTSLGYIGTIYQTGVDSLTYKDAIYYRRNDADTQTSSTASIYVYSPLSKQDNTIITDLGNPIATHSMVGDTPSKAYQFGANVVLYDQNTEPVLLSIVQGSNGWYNPTLTVREDYFTGAFDNIFVRGLNIDAPTGFTIPTSGKYKVLDDKGVTTRKVIQISRNGAGGSFTQDLVGQVIDCPQLSGAVQVREVVDGDNLWAYVLSPLITSSDTSVDIYIDFSSTENARWLFGYEQAYGSGLGYPDSVVYVNQRLLFGGNDKWGNLLCASRVSVLNDFDPNDGTESDAFSVNIASKERCRIVAMLQFSEELRLACTNGEYAVSTNALTPSGIIQSGFSLRSQVGTSVGSAICDCGGLTAYISRDKDAIYGTRFDLLKEQYSPISLTSQTSNIVKQCKNLVYLRNRRNQEGNLLVGLNGDGSLFGLEIDTNSGLVGGFNMGQYELNIPEGASLKINDILSAEYALWGIVTISDFNDEVNGKTYIVRFAMQEFFNFPTGLVVPNEIAQFINQDKNYFRGLISTADGHSLAVVQTITDNGDGTSTISFGDDLDGSVFTAGFLRQSDWRSVEISIGIATREINKKIVKLEGVIKPQEFWNTEHTVMETISEKDFSKFFDLLNTKEVTEIENQFITELPLDIYTENDTIIWRRAFDNPRREKYFGFTAICPFLVKSLTCTVEFDEAI